MADDKKRRDTLAVTDEDKKKPPPRDRDQSVNSPQRAHEKAERAETSVDTDKEDPGETLISRDNLEGAPPRSGSA